MLSQLAQNSLRIVGYQSILVRTDVFETIRTLQKQQEPRIGAKELVTALLRVALDCPATTKTALRLVRSGFAERLRVEAHCVERATDVAHCVTDEIAPKPGGEVPDEQTLLKKLYNNVHESHFADDFFAWLSHEIKQGSMQFNSGNAIAHIHSDGLLLASPRVFRAFTETLAEATHWVKVQKAVLQSGNVLQLKRRHVHEYLILNPRGRVGKSMHCVVLPPDICKALLPPLPDLNPMILGRASAPLAKRAGGSVS